jgi:hypothetical protein
LIVYIRIILVFVDVIRIKLNKYIISFIIPGDIRQNVFTINSLVAALPHHYSEKLTCSIPRYASLAETQNSTATADTVIAQYVHARLKAHGDNFAHPYMQPG